MPKKGGAITASAQAAAMGEREVLHVDDLLALNDGDFVRSAYRILLRRDPDPGGYQSYLAFLRHGGAKIRTLGEIRYSLEGRGQAVRVAGLRSAYLLERATSLPVLGWPVATLLALRRLARHARRLRRLENFCGYVASAAELDDQDAAGAPVPAPTEPGAGDSVVLQDLLSYRGREFVEASYRLVLKRSVDAEGLASWLELMHSGATRTEVLGRIRYSEEGCARGVDIAGLRLRFALALAGRAGACDELRLALPSADLAAKLAGRRLAALLRLHDRQFIDAAYQLVLQRAPDAQGLRDHLQRLRDGAPRTEVLGDIRYSPEGRSRKVAIEGLLFRYMLLRTTRLPLVGRVFRAVAAALEIAGLERRLNALEAAVRHSDILLEHAWNVGTETGIDAFAASRQPLAGPDDGAGDIATGHSVLPLPAAQRRFYYFVDHTVLCPVNTGVQRLVRKLGRALVELGEGVEFVKWDESSRQLVLVNRDDLAHLSRWGGPVLVDTGLGRYPLPAAALVPVPVHDAALGHWLFVPEVTHLTFHAAPVTLDVVAAARKAGLRTAFVFYDAIPLRRADMRSAAPVHEAYMQHLLLADLLLPISAWSGRDLIAFLVRHECARLDPGPAVAPLLLPGESHLTARVVAQTAADATQKRLILAVGSVEPRKNQVALIKAFERFTDSHPDLGWELALVGNLHPDVAAEVRRATRANRRVRYLKHLPDAELDALYRSCAFTVFPSVEEGFGLPILESLWYGKPCVCANFGAMAEVAEGGGCLTVDTRQVGAIENAITQLALDPVHLQRLSAAAMARPLEGWQDYARKVVAVIDRETEPVDRTPVVYYWIDHTCGYPANSGIQRVVRGLAAALIELGLKVVPVKWDPARACLSSASDAELAHLSKWSGPPAQGWSEWIDPSDAPAGSWVLVPELTTYLADPGVTALGHFARSRGLRCAWVFHDAIPWKRTELYPKEATRAHEKYMRGLNDAHLIFPTTRWGEADLVRFLCSTRMRTPALPERIRRISLPGELRSSPRARTARLRDASQPLRILCVGTLEPRKNHLTLLEAFARLQLPSDTRIEVVLAGGTTHPKLAATVKERLETLPQVRWEQSPDDARLAELYEACDFTVYPSIEEGFGLPIVESLWHARPCVCANFGAMAEVAEGGGCLTVDVRDPAALAHAIEGLLADPRKLDALAVEASSREFKDWNTYGREVAAALLDERHVPVANLAEPPMDAREFHAAMVNLEPRPLLSICITTYNRADWLEVSLRNMFRLLPVPHPEIEIVVCDNTSTDRTPAVLAAHAGRKDLRAYRNARNVGMLGNLRVTANQARGRFVWILGDDDLLMDGAIERILQVLRGDAAPALVYLNYAYTREDNAKSVVDLAGFLSNSTPIVPPSADLRGPVREICTANENFFTAIYCVVFRRDHALRAYSQNTEGRPFSTLLTCVPTTNHVLRYMMEEPACWIGAPQLVVNMNVSWMKYAPLWILERVPEFHDLAERMGADPVKVDRWRINNLPGVQHFFNELFSNDPEGNAGYLSVSRMVSRLKHLDGFAAMVPALQATYTAAMQKGHPAARQPVEEIFAAFRKV